MPSLSIRLMVGLLLGVTLTLPGGAAPQSTRSSSPPTATERLGKLLFFDTSLSARANQSCATCHAPDAGWVGGDQSFNTTGAVYEGSVSGRFGNRKPPSAAYATFAPRFQLMSMHHGGCPGCMMGQGMMRAMHGGFIGGNFWDGRATGEKLGTPAADQAMGPFLNPLEQALPDARILVDKVCSGTYGGLFREVWGEGSCRDADEGYRNIALSIAAYEGSREVNQFSSKYDAYLAGQASLTTEEALGLQLFSGKARCATCHPNRPNGTTPPLFTDFGFDNLGVPRNPANPFYANTASNAQGEAWRDEGLGAVLAGSQQFASHAEAARGTHRVPTLRNVDLRPSADFVKAYGHNGYFKSLESIVHFYNTRNVLPVCDAVMRQPGIDCWPEAEIATNINRFQTGNLGLTGDEEAAVVAFLRTLSDGHRLTGAAP